MIRVLNLPSMVLSVIRTYIFSAIISKQKAHHKDGKIEVTTGSFRILKDT